MPRKAAAVTNADGTVPEPRRSSRIKDQPKAEPAPKKAPAKPRVKKAAAADKEKEKAEGGDAAAKDAEKPKPARGRKRRADEEVNGAEGSGDASDAPAAKKVCFSRFFIPNVYRCGAMC